MSIFKGVLLVGGSGAGKSTILSILRSRFASMGGIAFPRRFVTRPPRLDDVSEENVAVTSDDLDDLEQSRRILFRWQKALGEGAIAHYAFEKPAAPFAVLGGNDALLMNRGSIRPSPCELDGYFKVLVFAPAAVRAERLLRRSPELADCAGEWQVRIEDNQSVLRPMVDMVLTNIDHDPSRNAEELLRVMELHVAEGG